VAKLNHADLLIKHWGNTKVWYLL